MRALFRLFLGFIMLGCICLAILIVWASMVPEHPKPFNPGGVGQATSIPR